MVSSGLKQFKKTAAGERHHFKEQKKWLLTKLAQSEVKDLKREEKVKAMVKGPEKFLEDAFNAADKRWQNFAIKIFQYISGIFRPVKNIFQSEQPFIQRGVQRTVGIL